ncbi:hypothetical protein ACFXPT_10920 [Streptomyces goshikiensis]|uniref:hypothetical protein n=1 Tax=Streptomyces goshikiensis TaxID=1942 RepID=UPI0036C4B0CA
MAMIAAERGAWFARFEVGESAGGWGAGQGGEGDDGWEELDGEVVGSFAEVIAWDGEGYALVVDRETGRLGRAAEREGFAGMCDAADKAEAETTAEEVLDRVERSRAEQEKRERRRGPARR